MSSSHYPSFYSHHYEKCDDEEDEELELIENRLIYGSRIGFHFCCHSRALDIETNLSLQPADSARDERMGRVQGPADQNRLRVDGQPSVHGNNGEDSQARRVHTHVHLGSLRGSHCKRYSTLITLPLNPIVT